ncbi:hypothetical protein [Paenibacillus sp. NPDC055715]
MYFYWRLFTEQGVYAEPVACYAMKKFLKRYICISLGYALGIGVCYAMGYKPNAMMFYIFLTGTVIGEIINFASKREK